MGLGLIDYNQLKGSNTIIKQKLDEKQDTLVSGENIKTINNESILGSGNINIQGGAGSLTIVDNLPSASEENYEKRNIYLKNKQASFIVPDEDEGEEIREVKESDENYLNILFNTTAPFVENNKVYWVAHSFTHTGSFLYAYDIETKNITMKLLDEGHHSIYAPSIVHKYNDTYYLLGNMDNKSKIGVLRTDSLDSEDAEYVDSYSIRNRSFIAEGGEDRFIYSFGGTHSSGSYTDVSDNYVYKIDFQEHLAPVQLINGLTYDTVDSCNIIIDGKAYIVGGLHQQDSTTSDVLYMQIYDVVKEEMVKTIEIPFAINESVCSGLIAKYNGFIFVKNKNIYYYDINTEEFTCLYENVTSINVDGITPFINGKAYYSKYDEEGGIYSLDSGVIENYKYEHIATKEDIENITEPLARALKIPVASPSEFKLAGFNTSREQENVGIGTGLKVEGNKLQINEEELPKQTPLTHADELPALTENEYNKHLLYLSENKLKYIAKDTNYGMQPYSNKTTNEYSLKPCQMNAVKIGNIIYYRSGTNKIIEYNIETNITTEYTITYEFSHQGQFLFFKKDENTIAILNCNYSNKLVHYEYNITTHILTRIFQGRAYNTKRALAKYDNYIYSFGGYDGRVGSNKIRRYNLITHEEIELGRTLLYNVDLAEAITIGTNIYILSGDYNKNKMQIFDCINEQVTSVTLNVSIDNYCTLATKNGKLLLLYGKINNTASNKIYEIDKNTGALTDLYTFTDTLYDNILCYDDENDYMYLLHGSVGTTLSNRNIYRIGTQDTFYFKTVATET